MMQNGVTLHENSKRETYAYNAKCSDQQESNLKNRLLFSFPKNSATFSAEVLVFGVVRLRTSTSPAPTRTRFFRLPPPPPLKIQTCKLGEQRPEEEQNEPCYNQKLPEAQSHEECRHGRTNRGENQRLLFTKSANPGIVVRSIPQKSTFRITSSAEGFVLK